MKGILLLNSNENLAKVEEEERTRFVREIFQYLDLKINDNSIDELWDEDNNLSMENKLKIKSILSTYNIQVIDSIEGDLQIYLKNDLIAEWNKPNYILKKDLGEKDLAKRIYLEMHIDTWSAFED